MCSSQPAIRRLALDSHGLTKGDMLTMPEIGVELPVEELHDRVDLPPEPPDEGR